MGDDAHAKREDHGQSRMLHDECVEIWRRRVRARFPDVSLAEVHRSLETSTCNTDQRAQLYAWMEKALSVADGNDELSDSTLERSPNRLRRVFAEDIRQRAGKRLEELEDLERDLKLPEGWSTSSLVDEIREVLKQLQDLTETDPLFRPEFLGLALSGGGIRSASFNLGILQAMSRRSVLRDVDYLSTVSGGGYIGASFTYHTARSAGGFPFRPAIDGGAEHPRISWIRAHGSYLNSGREVNSLTLGASILRGMVINLLFTVPLAFALLWVLAHFLGLFSLSYVSALRHPLAIGFVLLAGAATLFLFQQAKDRETPSEFRLSKLGVTLLWGIALVALWRLGNASPDVWIGVAFTAFIAPPVFLTLRTLLGLWENAPKWITDRPPLLIPETLAWLVVGGVLYLMLQPLGRFMLGYPFLHVCLMLVGAALFAKLIVNNFFMALMSGAAGRLDPVEQRYFSVQYGDLLGLALVLGVLGAVPVIDDFIRSETWQGYQDELLSGLTVTGVISTALGWMKRSAGNERRGYVAFLLRSGVTLLIGVVLLILHRLAITVPVPSGHVIWGPWGIITVLVIAWILGSISADLNYMSMHRYYRNRLADAFLGDPVSESFEETTKEKAKAAGLRHLAPEAVTYLSSRIPEDRERLGQVIEQLAEEPDNKKKGFGKKKELGIDVVKNALPGGRGCGVGRSLHLRDIRIGRSGSPYPLICTNLVLAGSRSEKYRLRRGDSFIFSPRYLGSEATGWTTVEDAHGTQRDMTLGTAMAISGAAVDPNTGVTSSLPLRIIMTLLNVRLGFWCVRPGGRPVSLWRRLWDESWSVLVIREMFALMHERSSYVRLSDGGHFDNLGLYELIRRRCTRIIVCDATADPKYHFADLARVLERIRVDFGVDVEMNTNMLTPDEKTRRSSAPFIRGVVHYPPGQNALGEEEGRKDGEILFVKTTLFRELPEDVRGYARRHASFPDEGTTDQFFSEDQFEAYRELGYRTGLRLVEHRCFASPSLVHPFCERSASQMRHASTSIRTSLRDVLGRYLRGAHTALTKAKACLHISLGSRQSRRRSRHRSS